jgi:transcriptional regulator with XRE-family HTH domain
VTKCLDPARDDEGVRLRTLRLRRGMTQTALAEMARISPTFVSMVETGQRSLRRADHILALADALRVSPYYLADGREDGRAPLRPSTGAVPFPPRCDQITLARHQHLARQLIRLAAQDGRATGDWLRRLARDPTISPWLLLDHLAPLLAAHHGPPATAPLAAARNS